MEFRIPVSPDLIRTIKDPTIEHSRIIHLYPKVVDLVGDIPLTPDPRKPKEKSPIVTRIARSLGSNDGRFHLLNRGITMSVSEATYDNRSGILTLDLPEGDDFDSFGVIDGGHTYRTVTTRVEDMLKQVADSLDGDLPLDNQYIHLEVLVKVQNHLADIAEARNYSVSLKPWTLAGYRDRFDWFLDAIGEDYRQHVKISENDEEPVGILDLIQVMCAINPLLFPNGEPATEAYKNAGKCLDYFTEPADKYGFRRLSPVCRDIIRLYDYVRYQWKDAYNAKDETGNHGRLGARREMHIRKRNRTAMATYYFLDPQNGPVVGKNDQGNEDFPVEKGFAIPAISCMRPLLTLGDDGAFKWYTNPFEFWDANGAKLVRMIMNASEAAGFNAQVVGRDSQVYSALFTQVRTILLEKLLAERGGSLPF